MEVEGKELSSLHLDRIETRRDKSGTVISGPSQLTGDLWIMFSDKNGE